MLPSFAYSVYSVLLFCLSALHVSYKGLRTQAERSGDWRQARKLCGERSQANSVFLNPLGSSFWALAYVRVSSPRVSRSISPIWMLGRRKFLVLTGIRGWSQTWRIAGSPKPRWLVPTLSPVGAHCPFVWPFGLLLFSFGNWSVSARERKCAAGYLSPGFFSFFPFF